MDLNRDIVMGHEFCAELVDFGPNTQKRFKPGQRICAMPVLIKPTGVETVGYSNDNPGGYAELMRLSESLLLEVPNGLSTERAALTEPMAVGYHAVQMARLQRDDAPLVIGCGPVGLAVIGALKHKGVPISRRDVANLRSRWAQTWWSIRSRSPRTNRGRRWRRTRIRRERRRCRRGCPDQRCGLP